MVSVGQFVEYKYVFLDGDKLTEGADYEAESGSTRLTIKTSTLTSRGSGRHTLGVEFRTQDSSDTLHRAAQNYYVDGGRRSGGRDNSGSSSGNSDSNNPYSSDTSGLPQSNRAYTENSDTPGTWKQEGSTVTLTDAQGAPVTGWVARDHHWYYFNEQGVMQTGWQPIGGKWCYFHTLNDGTMGQLYADTFTPDGYYVDEEGSWVPVIPGRCFTTRPNTPGNWQNGVSGARYFRKPDGTPWTDWIVANHYWYYLDKNGAMIGGWKQAEDGKWYFFQTEQDENAGMLYSDTVTPDGYQVGSQGEWDGAAAK